MFFVLSLNHFGVYRAHSIYGQLALKELGGHEMCSNSNKMDNKEVKRRHEQKEARPSSFSSLEGAEIFKTCAYLASVGQVNVLLKKEGVCLIHLQSIMRSE